MVPRGLGDVLTLAVRGVDPVPGGEGRSGLTLAVGEPVLAEVLPDILDRVQLWGARRQQDHGDVFRNREGCGRVPSGAVEQQDGMGAPPDRAGDLVEVKLHRLRVGEGQRQGGAGAAGRADRSEQVSALIALVGGLTRP